MRAYLLATIAGIALAIAIGFLCAGCVVVYAPSAERASLYMSERTATNMIITQDIPITAKVADELAGAIGAKVSGNTIKGIEKQK